MVVQGTARLCGNQPADVVMVQGHSGPPVRPIAAGLARQLGVRPEGWEEAVGGYAEDGFRSVADVVDAASLQKVRDFKKSAKAAKVPAE